MLGSIQGNPPPAPRADEVVVYYTIALAVHVSMRKGHVSRVVELREEIHELEGDPPMIMTATGLSECDPVTAELARQMAETSFWPENWEFGY